MKLIKVFFLLLSGCFITPSFAGNFTITPQGGTPPANILPNSTVSTFYTVTNNTGTPRYGYRVVFINPTNVMQNVTNTSIANLCGSTINLLSGRSCTLQIDISGPATTNFAICNGASCTTACPGISVTPLTEIIRAIAGFFVNSQALNQGLILVSGNSLQWLFAPLPVLDTPPNPAFPNSLLNDVQWNGNQFIAVGNANNSDGGATALILYSADGFSWSNATNISVTINSLAPAPPVFVTSTSLNSVSWNGSEWVAVGYISYTPNFFFSFFQIAWVLTSPDGINWVTQQPLPTDDITQFRGSYLSGISWSPQQQQFTAVGSIFDLDTVQRGLIMTSPDAITWTLQTAFPPPPDNNALQLNDVAWNAGLNLWSAVGYYINGPDHVAYIITSPDGINWTAPTLPPLTQKSDLNGIGTDGNLFVAVGDVRNDSLVFEALILTSSDGVNWARQPQPAALTGSTTILYDVSWSAGIWVAVGQFVSNGFQVGVILTSSDGMNYTFQPLPTPSPLDGTNSLLYGVS